MSNVWGSVGGIVKMLFVRSGGEFWWNCEEDVCVCCVGENWWNCEKGVCV